MKQEGLSGLTIKITHALSRRKRIYCGIKLNILRLVYYKTASFIRSFILKTTNVFLLKKLFSIGYASRSAALVMYCKKRFVLTADVGDSTISVASIEGGLFHRRKIVQYPSKSAPIAVCPVRVTDDADDKILIALFNYDRENLTANKCQILLYRNLARLLESPDSADVIIEREGHWGFRSINAYETDDVTYVATVDRLEGYLYILEIPRDTLNIRRIKKHIVDLNYEDRKAIPIFTAIVPRTGPNRSPLFIINKQGKNELTFVEKSGESYHITQRFEIEGVSRSNVAVGHFRNNQFCDAAVALWGGDPSKFYEKAIGKVCVLLQNERSGFDEMTCFDGGIHPTDVVAGDFDGDGLDELAILNYGCGMNHLDRTNPGDVQIFKFKDNTFQKVTDIPLPNPRIGLSYDIDGDGRDELFVSLFFEKKLALLKQGKRLPPTKTHE